MAKKKQVAIDILCAFFLAVAFALPVGTPPVGDTPLDDDNPVISTPKHAPESTPETQNEHHGQQEYDSPSPAYEAPPQERPPVDDANNAPAIIIEQADDPLPKPPEAPESPLEAPGPTPLPSTTHPVSEAVAQIENLAPSTPTKTPPTG
jgi:hypothetical protein